MIKKTILWRLLVFVLLFGMLVGLCWVYSISLLWAVLCFPILFFLLLKDFRGPYAAVIMNHGVSDRPFAYPIPDLVCHVELYDSFLRMLKKAGFQILGIDDFYAYKRGEKPLDRKSVLLTFDDGYLDNWVFAAPLLKKHGAEGVVFVSEDFIEKSDRVRKRFDEIDYDMDRASGLECLNYCSERELQLMDREGVLRVEAHAKSHTFYYVSDKIIGYYKQTEVDPFLEWNKYEEHKPYWMTRLDRKLPVGTPVFEYRPSCGNPRRYLPDPEAETAISAYIRETIEGERPFDQQVVNDILTRYPGRYETEVETEKRFKAELAGVKTWLESLLDRPVEYLAWPHGGISQIGLEMASRYYKLYQMPNSGIANRPSDPVNQMKRIGGLGLLGTPFQQRLMLLKIRSKIEMACGNYYWIVPFSCIKLLEVFNSRLLPRFTWPSDYKYNFKLIHS